MIFFMALRSVDAKGLATTLFPQRFFRDRRGLIILAAWLRVKA
jgi:hypothetical protein